MGGTSRMMDSFFTTQFIWVDCKQTNFLFIVYFSSSPVDKPEPTGLTRILWTSVRQRIFRGISRVGSVGLMMMTSSSGSSGSRPGWGVLRVLEPRL